MMNSRKSCTLIFIFFISYSISLEGQILKEDSFDFWIGDWVLEWTDSSGKTVIGSNSITKVLDGKIIQEQFENPTTGFKGTSISVYNPKSKKWYQSWADNGGGFFSFYGESSEENPVFRTAVQEIGNHQIIKRMVFKSITEDTFIWDWEVSKDNGINWELKWQIKYKRKGS